MFGRLSFTAFLVACVTALLFSGCAWFKPPVESNRTAAVSEPARDSLRAKFVLTVLDSLGKEQDLDAVLFSVPHKRYRMELTGPMGAGVASLLWTEEGWNMVFPTEQKYLSGVGYMVGLMGDNSVPMVPIHQMADIFKGVLVPERSEVLAESDSADFHVVKVRAPSGMQFTYGKRDGEIAWLMRGGRDGKPEILKFSEFKEFEGVRLPSNVEFEAGGKMFLKIRIKKVARNKAFSLGTWRLNVPKSYKRIGE